MKDIKSYIIGFLTCACLFLIMGQSKNDNLGDIVVESITIVKDGKAYGQWGHKSIMLESIEIIKDDKPYGNWNHNSLKIGYDEKLLVEIGRNLSGDGSLLLNDKEGNELVILGSNK